MKTSPVQRLFKLLLTTSFFLVCLLTGPTTKLSAQKHLHQVNTALIEAGAMKLRIDHSNEYVPELFKALKNVNDKLIYTSVVTFNEEKIMCSISRYESDTKRSIAEAFESNVQFRPAGAADNYRVLDWGTFTKNGKTLRFKITEIPYDSGVVVNSVIYYFMKDDSDYDLYELKFVCQPEQLAEVRQLAAESAATVVFR